MASLSTHAVINQDGSIKRLTSRPDDIELLPGMSLVQLAEPRRGFPTPPYDGAEARVKADGTWDWFDARDGARKVAAVLAEIEEERRAREATVTFDGVKFGVNADTAARLALLAVVAKDKPATWSAVLEAEGGTEVTVFKQQVSGLADAVAAHLLETDSWARGERKRRLPDPGPGGRI